MYAQIADVTSGRDITSDPVTEASGGLKRSSAKIPRFDSRAAAAAPEDPPLLVFRELLLTFAAFRSSMSLISTFSASAISASVVGEESNGPKQELI
mmetsp:Transcript_11155/g.11180  ORF Transcript_11155/g.11180 Transcript_11155/m.11180 type:complete len:96 (-) Transcript_11155:421-708(-)